MFKDRHDAGIQLAEKLQDYAERSDVLVLALPRGGVVVGAEIARALHAPLDVLIVRKIGHPLQPELAAGAISETGTIVYNQDVIGSFGVTGEYLNEEASRQREEIRRRQELYRAGRKLAGLEGRIIILVDDGVATGATMKSAVQALKQEHPDKLIAAVPVAPPQTAAELRSLVDGLVCLSTPDDFSSVGSFYYEFAQVTDEEVRNTLDLFRLRPAA